MADALLFIHGTGVRQEGYHQTMALLAKGLKACGLKVFLDGVCWGPVLGVSVEAKDIEEVMPPAFVRAGEIGPEEIGVRTALWAELLRDPLLELRMAAMRPPANDAQNAALPGDAPPDILLNRRLIAFEQTVTDPLPGEVPAQAVREASQWLRSEPLLAEAAIAAGDADDPDLVGAVARAIVAKALARYRKDIGTGPSALYVADDRDGLEEAIVKKFPATRGIGSWLSDGVKGLAEGAATYYGRDRRGGLMSNASPGVGDIMYYQRRGGDILQMIEEKIIDLSDKNYRVIVLAHSLGGIMMVDLLSRPRPSGRLPVAKLITVGSQAPMLFKFDALGTMRRKQPLPAGMPYQPWLNIYDRNDFLSFCASRAFPGAATGIEDAEVQSNVAFPEAHSAYFRQADFFKKIAESWPKP
ncbi:hypothetical protein [Methylobacterium radiotolerans]|uniref:hypothetical protein n=1 Tax=Methylobacterium radiotolerans TaxID=31998 RepID=UPI001F2B3F1B|nr:hypothetical protein [Methylobacterium radiotolerans]UIY40826.1 hypothetical protein LZ599_20705 [Methylobacterium radiotolerans]